MLRGVRLGVDVGTVRIGVSKSDPDGVLASPLDTVPRASDGADVRLIADLATRYRAIGIVVGHPLALSGRTTRSTRDAVSFAERLAAATAVPVWLVDERLSTVSAAQALHAAGKNSRRQRGVIDRSAAAVILQHALEAERQAGRPAGRAVGPSAEAGRDDAPCEDDSDE
ncbi:MAG TPA: Holliday junction resolvase RuvX [Microbacteriaceae bacterium]|nr:Holliday junction resolvase RuvX [Microbacteriaceae bacterium]